MFYEILIGATVKDLSFKDAKALGFIDVNFTLTALPICKNLKRVHSVEISFNCSINSEEEEIWLDLINPSLQINMPDEEFYAFINPEIGFKFMTGTILGSKMTAAYTARMKRDQEPVEFA